MCSVYTGDVILRWSVCWHITIFKCMQQTTVSRAGCVHYIDCEAVRCSAYCGTVLNGV